MTLCCFGAAEASPPSPAASAPLPAPKKYQGSPTTFARARHSEALRIRRNEPGEAPEGCRSTVSAAGAVWKT